ncbi:uncharacterized protein LOC120838325 [Ixodes scapularis]|uniref:uncharacterized protein LOC120838325 n=1 Tax=Ixodes scapularis TaxID=6945 RepID=UPI001C381EDF|nr:uncharacterized protein LOC120838325 [Ixodes scapularis]
MKGLYFLILVAKLAAEGYASRGNKSTDFKQRLQYQATCSSYVLKNSKVENDLSKEDPPIPVPLPCWSHIKNVGAIFCLLTGSDGYSRFDWTSCQLQCINSDFQLDLPFENFNPDELVICPSEVQLVLKKWERTWNDRKQRATKNLCKQGT